MGVLYTNYNFVQEIGMDMPSLPLGIGFEFRIKLSKVSINHLSQTPQESRFGESFEIFSMINLVIKSDHINLCKFSIYFARKTLLFLFYTSTFTIHPHQFIYSTHLFNKILILFTFLLFPSLSSLEPSHRPNTNPKSPTPSYRLLHQATVFSVEL